jgi:CRP-like cAMP-binding protein
MIPKVDALKRTKLFGVLSEQELLPFADRCQERRLAPGDLLFMSGDPAEGLFVVVEGRIRAFRHGADGREQVIHEDGPGGTFPEVAVFDNGPYPSTVVATEESTLLLMRKSEVRRICMTHPEVALSALEVLSRRLRRATGMVEEFALREVSQRVADYLLQQAPESPGREFHLRHTNQEVADRVGTVREVVSRAFSRLQKEGWIEKEGRKVRIVDLSALHRFSQGE